MEFEGIILKPGDTINSTELRDLTDSIVGTSVESDSTPTAMQIGEVTDAEYADGEGMKCTLEIFNEDVAAKIEDGVASLAPALVGEKDTMNNPTFRNIFVTPRPTDDVGEFDRKI